MSQVFEAESQAAAEPVDMEALSDMLAGKQPAASEQLAGEAPAIGEEPAQGAPAGEQPPGEVPPQGEVPPAAPVEQLAKARREFKDVNSMHAHGRRVIQRAEEQLQSVMAREQQLAQREQQLQREHEERLREVTRLETLMQSGDPALVQLLAEKRGVKPSEMLEQLQRAIVDGRGAAPTAKTSAEVEGLSKKIDQLLERVSAGETAQRKYYEQESARAQQESTRKAAVGELGDWLGKYGENYPHFAELTPEAQSQSFNEFVSLLQERGMLGATSADEIISALDENEKSVRGRYRTGTAQPAGGQAANAGSHQPVLNAGQSPPQRAAGNPAMAQKASAAPPRTVPNNHDAANGGGARREKTLKEEMDEVDQLFRTGKLPSSP